jgi:hypothetical protein
MCVWTIQDDIKGKLETIHIQAYYLLKGVFLWFTVRTTLTDG